MLSTITSVTNTLKVFLAGIAAISLIVWGIGIMNIMLVSVSERTREIGIRRSIWALDRDIISQFLTESVVLTFLGWGIGIIFAFLVVSIANYFSLTAIITSSSVIISFLCAVSIGIVFGILPAYKAAKLKPIDALRSE
jgi:putative ABC transport system permease protein